MRLWIFVAVLMTLGGVGGLAQEVTKERVLQKYEQVISKSNEMTLYGYDLKNVALKLRRMTDLLVAGDFVAADGMLNDISKDIELVEAKGPEYMRRERQLAWLEIFGDVIQQLAIFVALVFLILRLPFMHRVMSKKQSAWGDRFRMVIFFSAAAIITGLLGLVRYKQSSWAFIDLQVLFVAIAAMLGGGTVALAVGAINSWVRLMIVPGWSAFGVFPLAAAAAGWFFYRVCQNRPYRLREAMIAGVTIGLLHGLFVYLPISGYLPLQSFLFAVYFLAVVEGGVLVIFFLLQHQVYKDDKTKETEKELFSTQLQFLRAQINPHFLFNALNTIAAICGEEGAERARNLIIQLSALFRRLSKGESDYVSLQEELEYIDTYLGIEKARFGDRLEVDRDVRLSPSLLRTSIPILVLQPIVENAVKHGISKKPEGGKLTIRAEESPSGIAIEIVDNGVGMPEERVGDLLGDSLVQDGGADRGEHAGIGLRNIRQRLQKIFGDRFKLTVTSVPEQGTTIRMILPKAE